MNTVWRGAAGLVALGAGVLTWSTLVEPRAFALREFEVPVLPSGAAPLRVLHLSDLHLVPGQRAKTDWVRSLAALEPDLVITTGDNMAHQDAAPAVLDTYRDLLEIPGVFVLGSNDYFPPFPKNPLGYFNNSHRVGSAASRPTLPTADLVAGFRSAGWLDLTNARGHLEVAGLSLEFVGVDDPHLGYDRYDEVAGPASPGTDLFVGVTHAPYLRVLDSMTADGTALVLAGHTHGGQVCVPFYGALVTNCDLGTDRVKGLSRWWPGANNAPSASAPAGASWLEVSAGLGASPYSPFRLACRPEATLLTLV